ncbi:MULTISPECIES: iron-siderophore ABC transporter substrate-binding protein [Arthrobacter]|uniref:Iron-siderophore ABC transporter substrate-binding protein n=1 Tax=Arthrobacter jinronghuae TaxID=2964609 RepID=A0ABT1NMV3_9MICC|nr:MULTISPECIES: iron-siderophore ABC transporter substrate-binding protein [Arthrobacter]MCQ1948975.1 iron-siderophore ABC transporter substrate-binding protein [Arthrobacter jinronghuae]MCQ1952301.1 iron-siderophore ABC transporter substrate-binding protein [Arthrobacter sp. zg-Y238]MCQ1955582.1 iron-siderophore ABC transporter substrate-binding protein [Arthrobacter jinronghuae]UWX78225.1 iron-siderophore ABC transporter substrate-binding protein [Arthrobacter jinronghuae]
MKRTPIAAALAVPAVLLALSGCGADAGDSPEAGSSTAGSEHFPVTIDSALGQAVIEEKPERVVTIGWGSADTAVALGTTPVGVEEVTWGNDDHGNYPWVSEAIEERGDDFPATFTGGQDIDIDAIVALEPDLILAPNSGITQEDFDILNDLAPTVAYPEQAWNISWDDQISLIGKALGEPEAAQDAVDGIGQSLADSAAEHPEFAGKTFAYVWGGGAPGSLVLYNEGDARVDILTALGMTVAPEVQDIPSSEGSFTSDLGLENAGKLNDVDVLFTWYNDEAEQQRTEEQRLFAQIPAVERGSVVRSLDRQVGMASSFLTPLSVPWVLDRFEPMIEEAVAKVD